MPPIRPAVTSEYPYGPCFYIYFIRVHSSVANSQLRCTTTTYEYLGDEHRKARCPRDENTKEKEEDEEIDPLGFRHKLLALSSSELDRPKVKVQCGT